MIVLSILGWATLSLAAVGCGYVFLAAWFVGRWHRPKTGAAEVEGACAAFSPVTILKPLHGAEPGLQTSLETFFRQDYPAPVQIVFGVKTASDPAMAVARHLCAHYRQIETDLVVSDRVHGDNAKVSNLINMATAARQPLIVLSDSDIAVQPDYLRSLATALAAPGVGAVSCLYTGWAAVPGLGARLSAMGVSYHFLPNVVMGLSLGLAKPCMGSTIAIGAATLEKIGGFGAFAGFLADDYEIGRAVRALGLDVVVPGFAVRHAATETSLRDWFAHERRWMRTIMLNDPVGHIGSILTHPVSLALIATAIGAITADFSPVRLGILGTAVAARAVLKWQIDRRFGAKSGPLWLLPLRDICAFGVFLTSLAGGAVEWRGEKLHVATDGVLSKNRKP